MDKVVHFEIPVSNVENARKFYGSIFGWQLQDWGMPDGSVYVGASTVPVDPTTHIPKEPGAINGGIIHRDEVAKSPLITIKVSSIDEYAKRITEMGGKVLKPKWDILGMGFHAYLADPDGNVFGLWEDTKK